MRVRALLLTALAVLAVAAPASAQDSPPPSRAVTCPTTSTSPYGIVAPNAPVDVVVTAAAPTATVSLVREEADGATTTVRTGTGGVTWTVRLPQTTRLFVTGLRSDGHDVCGGREVLREVRPALTLHAVRNSPRDYTFSGRVTPGRGQTVGLFRVTGTGARVLTADAVVGRDGTYSLDRRFTGSGRFGFEVRVVRSATHLAGASPVRATVIH